MTGKIFVVLTALAVALTVMTTSIEAQYLPPAIPTTLDLNLLNTDGTNIDTTRLLTIDYYDSDEAAQSINSVDNAGDGSGKTIFWDIANGKSNVYSELSAKEGTDITVTIAGYESVTVTAVEGRYVSGDHYLNNVTQIPPTTVTTTTTTTTVSTTMTTTTVSTTTTTTTTTVPPDGGGEGSYPDNYPPSDAVWVKPYDSGGSEGAQGVAVDSNDNVVVTGDAGTIKYDSDGNQLWTVSYGGNGVAVDSNGDVYVTGSGTVKYDSDGNQLWTVSYGGNGVAVDSDGDVYVTGSKLFNRFVWDVFGGSTLVGWDYDYLTIKYNPDGNQIWNRTYNSGGSDHANGVAVDSNDNVIVTGVSSLYHIRIPTGDYHTIQYDSDGNVLWMETYNSGRSDFATGVAVDSSDNVIVTGYLMGSARFFNYNYLTIKYDPTGIPLWNHTYDSGLLQMSSDYAYGVAVDSDDNVYVTGASNLSGNYDYLTIQYNADGNQLWNFTYDSGSDDYARGVSVDPDGSVYVTGKSNGNYLTIKYVVLNATVDIRPDTLDLNGHDMGRHGMGISAYIELPGGYDVADINVSTVVLGGTIPAELRPAYIGDYDRDGIADLLVSFERSAVQELLNGRSGDVELTVTGALINGIGFKGSDTIRVIEKSSRKTGHMVRRR